MLNFQGDWNPGQEACFAGKHVEQPVARYEIFFLSKSHFWYLKIEEDTSHYNFEI